MRLLEYVDNVLQQPWPDLWKKQEILEHILYNLREAILERLSVERLSFLDPQVVQKLWSMDPKEREWAAQIIDESLEENIMDIFDEAARELRGQL